MAWAKWLVACDEVKLELRGQEFIKKRNCGPSISSRQGRVRRMVGFMIWLLIMSLRAAHKTTTITHHQPLTPKLLVTNSKRNKYRGTQNRVSRINGRTVS